MCSSPTEMRTMSGGTPAASCWASSSWRCVVLAGWLIRVRVSPMLTRWLMNCALSMNFTPLRQAALHAKGQQPRGAAHLLLHQPVLRVVGRPG
jgi:hypothetical protein